MGLLKYLLNKNNREEYSKTILEKFYLMDLQICSIYGEESLNYEKMNNNIFLQESKSCECIFCKCCAA